MSLRNAAGTQKKARGIRSIARLVQLLKEIAKSGTRGATLSDLVVATGLSYSTTHRILRCLIDLDLALKDPRTRRYSLGHLVYELGIAAVPRINLREVCEPIVSRIADRTGDSVYLHVRSGLDVLCIDRKSGKSPIKTHVFDIGSRRPLGVGCGGIALLAPLPEEEIEEIVHTVAPRLSEWRVTPRSVLLAVARAKQVGYAATEGAVVKWVNGVSIPFGGRHGLPQATISVTTISPRLPKSRVVELVAMLRGEIREMEQRLMAKIASSDRTTAW